MYLKTTGDEALVINLFFYLEEKVPTSFSSIKYFFFQFLRVNRGYGRSRSIECFLIQRFHKIFYDTQSVLFLFFGVVCW